MKSQPNSASKDPSELIMISDQRKNCRVGRLERANTCKDAQAHSRNRSRSCRRMEVARYPWLVSRRRHLHRRIVHNPKLPGGGKRSERFSRGCGFCRFQNLCQFRGSVSIRRRGKRLRNGQADVHPPGTRFAAQYTFRAWMRSMCSDLQSSG